MADIELVIKIPEEKYNMIKNKMYCGIYDVAVYKAIANGTLLTKGHGNIVDIETLCDMFWDGNSMEITKYDLSVIEPIIEADKTEVE